MLTSVPCLIRLHSHSNLHIFKAVTQQFWLKWFTFSFVVFIRHQTLCITHIRIYICSAFINYNETKLYGTLTDREWSVHHPWSSCVHHFKWHFVQSFALNYKLQCSILKANSITQIHLFLRNAAIDPHSPVWQFNLFSGFMFQQLLIHSKLHQ